MKTNSVTTIVPFALAERLPCKDRVELSLIFMVAAAVGGVVLASRGFPATAEIAHGFAGGLMFSMLWTIPKLTLRNVARTLILGFVWSALSITIQHQVESVMTNPVSHQEVYSR